MSLPIKSLEVIHGTGRRNHLVDRSEGEGVHPNSRQDGPNLLAEGRSSSAVPASQEQSNRQECGLQGQVSGQWSTRYGRGDSIDGSGLILVPKEMSPMEIEAFRRPTDKELRSLQRPSISSRISEFKEGVRLAFAGEHESLAAVILVHGSIVLVSIYICLWFVRIVSFVFGGGMQ